MQVNDIRWIDIVNLLAIVLGPIAAVMVTRIIDNHRARRERRMSIFRILMSTRRQRLSAEHVSAVNIIEVEFYRNSEIIHRLKEYMQFMSDRLVSASEDWEKRWNELFTLLLQAIGKNVGYNIEQLDIFHGGYAPQSWQNIETEQQMFRRLIIELLEGRRSIPITNMYQFKGGSQFPPPPQV